LANHKKRAISWLRWSRYLIIAWSTTDSYRCVSEFTIFHQFNSLYNQAPHLSVVRLMINF